MRINRDVGGNPGDLPYGDDDGVLVPLAIPADWASQNYRLGIVDGFPAWVLADALDNAQALELPAIASGSALYAPSVSTPIAPTDITGAAISSGSALYAPTVALGITEPDAIANLFVWLKSDADVYSDSPGTTPAVNNDPVAEWWDQVSGLVFSQSNSGRRPDLKTGIVNGLPVLRFDAGFDGMQGEAATSLANPYTVFLVYAWKGSVNAARRVLTGDSGNWLLGPYNGQHSFHNLTGFVCNSGAAAVTDTFVAVMCWDDESASKFFINTVDHTVTGTHVGEPGVLAFAFEGNFGEFADSDVAEVIVYDRKLNSTEIDDVWAYLQDRYGLW